MWAVLGLVRAFDPPFAAVSLTDAMTRDLRRITPLRHMIPALLTELPALISAARGFTVDHKDVDKFTKAVTVLEWWFKLWRKVSNLGQGSTNSILLHTQLSWC